jgi:hypothetical protein
MTPLAAHARALRVLGEEQRKLANRMLNDNMGDDTCRFLLMALAYANLAAADRLDDDRGNRGNCPYETAGTDHGNDSNVST